MPALQHAKAKPLRRQLLVLALGGMLPLALLAFVGLAYDFQEQTSLTHQRALETTRALATAVDAEIDRSIAALRVLATSEALDRGDIPAFEAAARRAVASQPGWRFVSLAGLDGRHLVNTFFKPGEALPDRQREPESFTRALQTAAPQVGTIVNGRDGWAFPVRFPVVREGTVRYVLTAVAKPDVARDILMRQRMSDDWVLSVFDSAGARVARSKSHEKMLGTRGHESLRSLLSHAAPEGVGVTTTMEGENVFTAYTRSRSGWSVVMGLPVAAAHAPAWTSLAFTSAVVVLSLVAGLFAALFLARRINEPMSHLTSAANSLVRGEVPRIAPSGLREVDEVASALTTAAEDLHRVQAERAGLLAREREARAQAEAANHSKDQFLAMLGHELRNPLAALSSASALLEMGVPDPNAQKQLHGVIRRQVGNLGRLTDDLLDTARALLGKIDLRRAPVDLARVAANAINALAMTGRSSEHRIERDLHEAWVSGDEVRLEQVACNLLVNATKYTPAGKLIRVTTRREDGHAILVVEDEGHGLSPELAARVFDPFVQGKRSIDRAQGGLGVGLTLVKSLVELHGGTVAVRSEGEDRGAEFIVSIPAMERVSAPDIPRAPSAKQHARVLIIEDNDDGRETLAILLGSLGYEVHTACDGPSGIELARGELPDIALVDVGLPRMDGYEVARRLRAEHDGRMMIVALTGYGSAEDRARALAAGFDEHLTKPLDVERLQQLIAKRSRATA